MTTIDLTWNTSADTGGSGLAGYRVFRDGAEVGTTAVPSYSDTGLTAGTEYFYTISAFDNASNESLESNGVNITTLLEPDINSPTIPTGISYSTVTAAQVDLVWNASTDTGGSGLAGYRIFRDDIEIGTSVLSSYTDTGLDPLTEYTYTITAYDNEGNESAQSDFLTVTTLEISIRVNAGGGEYTDANGKVWSADYGSNTGRLSSTTSSISGTTDEPLFQTARWDDDAAPEMQYSFDVPNADYTVNLYFAETYGGAAMVGGRVFDILMEDSLVQNDLDIYSAVGEKTALIMSYNVTVTDGQLNIEFLHQIEDTKICAIEILIGIN